MYLVYDSQRLCLRFAVHYSDPGMMRANRSDRDQAFLDDLMTVCSLAVELGVNANTVSRVYRDLQNEGLLRLERGVWTTIARGLAGSMGNGDAA